MRIWIQGTSCSGKSTLSKQISREFGIPHLELDNLYWKPGWVETTREELVTLATPLLEQPHWVADGNYRALRPLLLARCDFILTLDYPFPIVFYRACKRTFRRIFVREETCNGNYETLPLFFTLDGNMLLWVLRTFRLRHQDSLTLAATDPRALRIRQPREIPAVLQNLHEHFQ